MRYKSDLTVDDQAAVADIAGTGAYLDGRWLDGSTGVASLPEGAELTEEPEAPLAGRVVTIVGGPLAGRWFALAGRSWVLGRHPACDVVLDDPTVSPRHALLDAGAVHDLGSLNGTRAGSGGVIRLGATQLVVRDVTTADRHRGLGPLRDGHRTVNRPPRAPLPPPADRPAAPDDHDADVRTGRAVGLGAVAGPLLMGGAMVAIYGDVRMAVFAALAPVLAVGAWLGSRRRARRERRTTRAARRAHEVALAEWTDGERRRLEVLAPDPFECVRRATLPSVQLWERRPGDEDWLQLRAGLGSLPVVVDATGVIGITGDRNMAEALARSLVVQAAVHHGPSDLALDVRLPWDWVKWLPHARAGAASAPVRLQVCEAGDAVAAPAIVLAPTAHLLPASCTTVLTAGELGDLDGGAGLVVAAAMEDEVAASAARRLARFRDVAGDGGSTTAALPEDVGLLEVLGLEVADLAAAVERSRSGTHGLRVPIGSGPAGPVEVDLVTDGPHLLVGGTTGSGKSELLRALVAGLAARHGPDEVVVVLVDYKGGSAFDECARLPHVVGLVTDLDGHLGERALRSLEAELRHREQVLRDAGVAAVDDCPGLPRLVVVVDEFATLAAELPEVLGALVGIAQRGRSLGVHLVLATQRPSGTVNANIRANTNLRIALRVQDASDSTDVVDAPDAATIERSTPGRAYVRRGPGELELVQVPFASRPQRMPAPDGPTVRPFVRAATDDERPVTGRTELAALVDAIVAVDERRGRPEPRRPWLPMLPDHVTAGDLPVHDDPGLVAFAVADEPDRQRRVAAGWRPADGNLGLFGMPGSGTSTAIRALVGALPAHTLLYAIDHGRGLRDLEPIGPGDHEAQARLVRTLRAELERRRTGHHVDDPLVVTVVDGADAFLADHDGVDDVELVESFRRCLAEGPAVGIVFVLAAQRVGALPLRFASLLAQKLLFRLADPNDYALAGLRRGEIPTFVPGRAVEADGGRVLQVVLAAASTGRRALPVATLPLRVHVDPPAIGVADDDLEPVELHLHPGEHLLVTGPPRSGKTTALLTLASALRHGRPDGTIVAICRDRSPLCDREVVDAAGPLVAVAHLVQDAEVVLVDDAIEVEDVHGIMSAALRDGRARVIAAARADDVRAAYSHWVKTVRQSRSGLLLQPDLVADGDLLGVRLPRRLTVPAAAGRGFLVRDGEARLLQVALQPG